MEYLHLLKQAINKYSRLILLVTVCILTVWGFSLYFEAEDHELLFLLYYDLRVLVLSLILGLIVFFAVRKIKFRFTYLHTVIWLIFGSIIAFVSLLLALDKNKADGDYLYLVYPFWRTGQWILFSLIIYIANRYENKTKKIWQEKIIIPLYIIFGNLAIIALHDLYCSIVFAIIALIGLLLLKNKTAAVSIFLINIIVISLFVTDYKIAPEDLHIPSSLRESNLAGCSLHYSSFFLCEGPYNFYFDFDQSPRPVLYNGDMIQFIRIKYGYSGTIFLFLMYSVIICSAILAAKKATHKSHSATLLLLALVFTFFTLAGMAAGLRLIPLNSEGLPFVNAGNSKQLLSFILISAVYKELKWKSVN